MSGFDLFQTLAQPINWTSHERGRPRLMLESALCGGLLILAALISGLGSLSFLQIVCERASKRIEASWRQRAAGVAVSAVAFTQSKRHPRLCEVPRTRGARMAAGIVCRQQAEPTGGGRRKTWADFGRQSELG